MRHVILIPLLLVFIAYSPAKCDEKNDSEGVSDFVAAMQPHQAMADSGEPNAAMLVQAVRKSENWIHEVNSLYVRIESRWTTTPEGIAAEAEEEKRPGGRIRTAPSQPSPVGILEYVIDHERKRVRRLTDTPGQSYQLTIWNGTEFVNHSRSFRFDQEQYYFDSKIPERTFHEFMAVDTSWPRSQPHSFWFDPKDTEGLLKYWGPAEDFVLMARSNYRGVDCDVLDCDRTGVPGMAPDLVRRWYVGVKDKLLYGLITLRDGKPDVEHWVQDYRQAAPNCWFPMTQGYKLYDMDEKGEPFLRSYRDLKVVKLCINEKLPEGLFKVELKEGVEVVDERSGERVTYTYKPEPPALVGKALPPFEGIEVDFATEEARGKMLLVCFWDMNQRPSRNCILEVSKRTQELKAKDTVIIAIQASKVDESTLNEWAKKSNIPFPIGIVEGDSEKTRFVWGVKSLPWLILTDTAHIVRAEGFAYAELDEKLESK
jgi:hypothetical protein